MIKLLINDVFSALGTYFINLQMKMSLWVLGLLVLMLSTLMIGAFAVGRHLVNCLWLRTWVCKRWSSFLWCSPLLPVVTSYNLYFRNIRFVMMLDFCWQIVNGRLKLEIHVLHHLTGAAVAFANQWKEWRRCTSAVGRAMKLSGTPVSETISPRWL